MLVHVGWMFLFFAGLFAFMQQWHNPLWIGSLVCVVISMCAVLLFVCGALYETYIMMDVDYSEEAVRSNRDESVRYSPVLLVRRFAPYETAGP